MKQFFYNETNPLKVLNHNFQVPVKAYYFHEDEPFDGDDPEDLAAFARGDFIMVGIEVKAQFEGMTGLAHLGMVCMKNTDDLIETLKSECLIEEALEDLAANIISLLGRFTQVETKLPRLD